ncbi:T9SS type A sorting domain-containing protein [Chryseobacterium sp.]|uniref:T9SS type A sorting domain-containing protein n=1 Tax=Chryseobacterium sp. TaxID=1871047 RepID=UPI002898A816|nr:T9SS type A sorting domain-containing protein [Chryseobacterium sp.]
MRKSLFAIGLLAAASSVQAQNVLLHVDDAATTYVSKGTLVYNGGGLQMRGNGVIENHGNIMVSGASTDSFKTITTGGADKPEGSVTANFVNKLNEPDNYATPNTNSSAATPTYTYGQLYITGIPQTNITGIVDQEYRWPKHGTYQQVGLPFYDKTVSSLSNDFGKTFSNVRYSQNEILTYNNTNVVSNGVNTSDKLGTTVPAYAYYMLGGNNLDVSTALKTVKGRPVSDIGQTVTLTNAGNGISFGTNGTAVNAYNEQYRSYSQDRFEIASGGASWQGNYSRNIYQFANPFLTNLDLRNIAYNEPAANGDGVNLSNIYGVRLEPGQVSTVNNVGTGTTTPGKYITFNSGVPTGDVDYMMIKPMGTFQIKLNNNNNVDQLNFANLRRFNYYSRGASTDYSVTANKNASKVGTVKQLGVIGLDANGNEVGRTYYVVYPNAVTGRSVNAKTQVTARGGTTNPDFLGTYEEALTGGADPNFSNSYWLYINEANETNFRGKNIILEIDPAKVKSYKFEIREDAALINDGQHQLSSGTGFYYQALNGSVMEAKQGDIVAATSGDRYNLYYGMPDRNVLAVETVASTKPSQTVVVYNPDITNYIVRFDPSWKKADIEVYDMSGKLVLSKKAVDASTDFVIELNKAIKASYVVKVVSEKGETVNTKILK